jgi:hypothetical protein
MAAIERNELIALIPVPVFSRDHSAPERPR